MGSTLIFVGKTGYQKNSCDVPPPQCLSLGTAGQDGFNILVIKTAAGASLFGAAAFILFWDMGASATIIVNYSISALPIQNSDARATCKATL